MDTKLYIETLASQLKEYNKLYREGKPAISDSDYDRKVEELRSLCPEHEWFRQAEPAPVNAARKQKLPIPMKSLNKVKTVEELFQWAKSLGLPLGAKLVITPKYDGVSWLHKEASDTTYSRGGAENEGQDCSAHYIKGEFDKPSTAFLAEYTFGELVFSRKNWERKMAGRVSDSTGEPYRSPRNTVAGFINRDTPPEDIRHASFIRYGADEKSLFENWSRFSDFLVDLYDTYDTSLNTRRTDDKDAIIPFWVTTVERLSEESLQNIFSLVSQYYYVDGLVIYINDLHLWKTLGRQQTTGNPLYAIAYKHPGFTENFETTVKGIDWRVSKSGALKPVVQIDAVDTGDCTMENPTGYNAKFILNHGIGKGAEIVVTRSGGVIPKILKTLRPGTVDLPKTCPACGAKTAFNATRTELCCMNPYKCSGVKLAKIIHFFNVVGVESIGEETFARLYEAGFDSIRKILTASWDELLKIEGFGESMANTIISQMQRIKEGIDLATYMHASDCFEGIGKIKAQNILDEMDDEGLASFCQGWYYSGWQQDNYPSHPEFASLSITRQNLFLGYNRFWQFVEELCVPYILPRKKEPTGTKCQGFSVCFSGIRDKELEAVIIDQGGKIANGVNKHTTHLVVKDVNGASSKMSKARQLGIPIMTVEDFRKMC